jgi:hypothetical protein
LDQQAVRDAIADLASIVYNDKYVTHDVWTQLSELDNAICLLVSIIDGDLNTNNNNI